MPKRSKVIIIFAKEPVPGRVKTRLAEEVGAETAARLYETFVEKTLQLCAELEGVDRILFYDPPESHAYFSDLGSKWDIEIRAQHGESLGDRMRAAFRMVFDLGYKCAAIVGTDSPTLPLPYLEKIFELCDQTGFVLGPATDGGYYAIALSSPEDALFTDIPWSTSQVLPATLLKAKQLGRPYVLLPPWSDIDRLSDLDQSGGMRGLGMNGDSIAP